jgi:hypothetical protein
MQSRVPKPEAEIPKNIHVCSDVTSDIDAALHVAEAKAIFAKICPNEEFLPKAPEPDEIIWVRNSKYLAHCPRIILNLLN